MKNYKIWMLINVVLAVCFLSTTYSQQSAKFQASVSSIQIKGTSNLHDWEEIVKVFNVELTVVSEDNMIKGISKVVFSCQSESVESDNSIMTGKTHDALNVEKYTEIRFTQTSADNFQNNNGTMTGIISGNLFLAGITQKITLTFKGNLVSNKLTLTGSKKLKMSDFKISPPTAMFGSLKTGDEVELIYSLQFLIN